MVLELSNIEILGMFMLAALLKASQMEMESTFGKLEQSMKADSRMEWNMGLVDGKKVLVMELISSKETIEMINEMGMEHSNGDSQEHFIEETSKMISQMDMEFTHGMMVLHLKVNSKMENHMAKERSLNILMVEFMKDSLKTQVS